jgi:hypothetical protein
MTKSKALAQLPPELHSTYETFYADYEIACREAGVKKYIPNNPVFLALLKSGRWRKLIP